MLMQCLLAYVVFIYEMLQNGHPKKTSFKMFAVLYKVHCNLKLSHSCHFIIPVAYIILL